MAALLSLHVIRYPALSSMSLRRINLAPITLSSPSDKLSLHLEYEVAIRLPSAKLATLSVDECLKVLTSDEVWVARGNSCGIDFRITLDGKELTETNHEHIIESLGKSIAESEVGEINILHEMFIHYLRSTYQQIWAQLGLCTTLHLKKGSVSLHLNHDELSSLPAVSSRPWSSTTTDIKTPETVLCAQMEQLTVSLAFLSTSARNEISKRVKISQNSVNGKKIRSKISAESLKVKPGSSKKISVLLEECPDSTKPPEATQPQVVIRPSIIKVGGCCHEMTGLLKECSDNLFSSITLHVIPALSQLGSFVSSGQFLNKVPSSVCTRTLAKGRKRRRALPVKPSNAENGSFETTKNDSVPSKDATNDEMSLISGTEENGIQPLNINSWSSSTVKAVPRKRCLSTFNSEIAHALDLKASCNLVNTAMRIMIADTEMRQKTIKGLKIHNTSNNLATSLASLSPVMFSPGFKKVVLAITLQSH